MGGEEDNANDLPYRSEYAKSGRAKCKGCKVEIPKGDLRLAAMTQVLGIDPNYVWTMNIEHTYIYDCLRCELNFITLNCAFQLSILEGASKEAQSPSL